MSWLWKGYIPRGSLTLLEGPPKAGKSTLLADLAARVSSGIGTWPDGQPIERPGAVLMLSDEDSAAHVIVPRLRVAGALLGSVHILKAVDGEGRPRQFVIGSDDIALLESRILQTGAVLVIVDPLSIYMGGTDAHREQEVRQVLWHLSELAERTGCAIVVCRHWKKAKTGDALTQGGGSVGFSAAARAILSVARNPDDKTARVLAVGGGNYGTDYPSQAFRLVPVPGEDVARVKWEGISRHDADALAAVPAIGSGPALVEAEDFLTDLLHPRGRVVPSNEVFAAADTAGHTRGTVRRAKTSLGVVVGKLGLGGWGWSLPGEDAHARAGIDIFGKNRAGIEDSTLEHLRRCSTPPEHGDAWEGDGEI
jgi:hypothetical protein